MEDVIFAGTATRPSRDFAEVSILPTRANEDGERTEGRPPHRARRGLGLSRINGRDVRAKDVALAVRRCGDRRAFARLGQPGRIAAIIAAKPAERRAMLEEAAGIAGLHVRRKDAEQKLRATEANLTRLDELIGDMEARACAAPPGARRPSAIASSRPRSASPRRG
jgi:chromosome segregation protein